MDGKHDIQRYNLQYFDIDKEKIWFVACQLKHNMLFYYDLDEDAVKFVACIAAYVDDNYKFGYCVLKRIKNKIIIAPYQSTEHYFVEVDVNSGEVTRQLVPEAYYNSTADFDDKAEFSEVVRFNDSLFFFSIKRKAFIEYNANVGKYIYHDELKNVVPDVNWALNRHSVVQIDNVVYLPIRESAVIVEYDFITHKGCYYTLPFNFKMGMMTAFNGKFVFSSMDSYDLVFWDKEKRTFDLVRAGDIVPHGTMPRLLPLKTKLLLAPWDSEGIWCFVDNDNKIKIWGKSKKIDTFCDVVCTNFSEYISLCYRFPESVLEIYDLKRESCREVQLYCEDEVYREVLRRLDGNDIVDEGYMPLDIFLDNLMTG